MFKIVSYNTHLFGKTLPEVGVGFYDDFRLNHIIERLIDLKADVICLCEVWDNDYKRAIIEKLGYGYNYYPSSGVESLGDGLLILSNYPITNVNFTRFNDLSGFDSCSRKGFISASIYTGNDQSFRLFFTHTQADDDKTDVRAKNFAQIARAVEEFYPGTPAIILGDLNVPAVDAKGNSGEYKSIMTKFSHFTDGWLAKNPDDAGATCDPNNNNLAKHFDQTYPARYDYIFLTKNDWNIDFCNVITDWKNWITASPSAINYMGMGMLNTPQNIDLSDHYPIWTRIEQRKAAIIPMATFDSEQEAVARADQLKRLYGDGVSNLIIINNRTQQTLRILINNSRSGNYSLVPPPVIPPGKFAAAFHHHPDGLMKQSMGAFVYRIEGNNSWDVFCGFASRWSVLEKNKVYTEIREINHWSPGPQLNYADFLYEQTDSSGYDHTDMGPQKKYRVKGHIDTGTSPLTYFTIEEA